jgi:hypothetical protein
MELLLSNFAHSYTLLQYHSPSNSTMAVSEVLYTIISSAHPAYKANHSRSMDSSRIISSLSSTMSDIRRRWTAQGREYIEYRDKFIKRSLAPNEYDGRISDPSHYSSLNIRRLQNEANYLEFIARTTTIPVPRVLAAYKRDRSFILEIERIDGVLMQDLKLEEQLKVMPQVRNYLQMLHRLRSDKLGRPSGIICPPQAIVTRPNSCKSWSQGNISTFNYVFCHRDVSQSNLYFHPTTLTLVAIGDWEYGGFYPKTHKLPFFESPVKSGVQVKTISGIKEIKEFWKKASNELCTVLQNTLKE